MGRFLAKNEGPSIDKADILLLPREDAVDGWLLSTSTSVFSKMDLSKPLPLAPSRYPRVLSNSRTPARLALCQPFSQSSQCRTSTSSDSSEPGLVEDPPCSSGSDTTVEDHQLSENECWDSYFWSQDKYNVQNSFYRSDSTLVLPFNTESDLSPYNRNFASANLSGLNVNEYPAELHRSDARRAPRRTPRSLPQNTYSPFPAAALTQSHDSAHKSWPIRSDSQHQPQRPRRAPLRSRAYTTPTNCRPLLPSNLSTCSTLDNRSSPSHSSSSSASGLYMCSAPVSPDLAPPLMHLMEKSYFDDDSDDESKLAALATRLNIRSTSSNSSGSCKKKEKQLRTQKSRRNLMSAVDKVKCMFGAKELPGVGVV